MTVLSGDPAAPSPGPRVPPLQPVGDRSEPGDLRPRRRELALHARKDGPLVHQPLVPRREMKLVTGE